MPELTEDALFFVLPEARRRLFEEFENAIEAGKEGFTVEFQGFDVNGDLRTWLAQSTFIRDEDNKTVRMIGVTQDITERKQAEAEREKILASERAARQQVEEASRLKDEFLATVSHELRTPLNAILGWARLLTSSDSLSQADTARAVEIIYRNAKSQAQLIEDILDVSRIITGKLRLDAQAISLAPIVQATVESLRPAIDAKNIRLQMLMNFEPEMVYADPTRIQQVIWNLLSNAIKFTPEKGQVNIRLESGAAHTVITVADTGKGISHEFLPFVFERFRQADGSSTRNHGGLGLGLAIVRHIVELHGGTIEVASAGEDQGSIFTVRLPVMSENALIGTTDTDSSLENLKRLDGENEDQPLSSSPTEELKEKLSGGENRVKDLRVLVLDDEKDTLEVVTMFLKQNGADVRPVTNVGDALEIIKQWRPDVVVSDIAMPGEDGYSFIQKLRAFLPEDGGEIPAIALTAYVGAQDREKALANGFQLYLAKPVELGVLLETLADFNK